MWEEQITEKLENKLSEISPTDFRFYNISHFPIIAKRTAKESDKCSICASNTNEIEHLIDALPHILTQNASDRRNFDQKKNKIEKHLRKKHHYHFPGYYAALGSLIGLFTGIALGVFLRLFTEGDALNKLSILFLGVTLLTGWFIGTHTDKKLFRKNLQL